MMAALLAAVIASLVALTGHSAFSLSNPNGAFCCRAGSIAYRSREYRLVVL